MTTMAMKKIFDKLIKYYDNDKSFQNYLKNAYNTISVNVAKDLRKLVNNTIKWTGKQLQMDININDRTKQKIIKRKIKGLNIFDRIGNSRRRLEKVYKKVKNLEDKEKGKNFFKHRVGVEYRRIKKTINTDSHRIKENAKYEAGKFADEEGVEFEKIWNCTFKNSRDAHIKMHQQKADEYGFFTAPGGEKTRFPGYFGVAKLDINCHCYVDYERVEEV